MCSFKSCFALSPADLQSTFCHTQQSETIGSDQPSPQCCPLGVFVFALIAQHSLLLDQVCFSVQDFRLEHQEELFTLMVDQPQTV